MKHFVIQFAKNLFNFFSSLKLAVVTLLTLAAVLAVGTIYESLYDAQTAKHYIYGTVWFVALLCFLGLNVLTAALSRWPWKRHHIGFLITHLGIILILTGSLVTLIKGYEGQLILAEGESGRRMTLKESTLFLFDPQLRKLDELPAEFRFNAPSVQEPYVRKALEDVLVKVDEYLPHAVPELKVSEGQTMENPALKVKVSGSRATVEDWVFSRDYERQSLQLGPASVSYIDVPDEAAFRKIMGDPQAHAGPLLWIEGQVIPVLSNVGKETPLGIKTLMIDQYLPHAAVTEEGLKNLGQDLSNPAVSLRILQKGKPEEKQSAFAKFPYLSSLHNTASKSTDPVRLLILPQDLGKQKNEMILARTDNNEILYSIRAGDKWSPIVSLHELKELPTGWMDFKFSITQNLQKAEVEQVYRKVPVPKGKDEEGPPPAIHIAVANLLAVQDFWLGRGEEREVGLGNRRFKIAYGLQSKPLGFEVKLNDFQMGLNEGTNDPASYQSQVTLIDQVHLKHEDHLIAMNEPMKYGKYKFFQASYQLNPGGPDLSVLAVAYDPGIFLKYLGAIIMVSGIATMFFLKPLFVQKRIAEKKLKQVRVGTGIPGPASPSALNA